METYTLVIKDDKPFPYTTQITDGNGNIFEPNYLDKLPIRVVQFLDLVKENSEVIRVTGIQDVKSLFITLMAHGKEYGDIICSAKGNGKNCLVTLQYENPLPKPEDVPVLKCMNKHYDGAHCGLGDWYPEIETGIQYALKGKKDWTTGWYSSKKEIASARISKLGDKILVEVSVSDDFDTEGMGTKEIPFTKDLEIIRKAIYAAWEEAEDNQKDNRQYAGWSIGLRKGKERINWIETYLYDIMGWRDTPPGDSYHKWGWQGETDEIPKKVRKALEKGILEYKDKVISGKYMAEIWK